MSLKKKALLSTQMSPLAAAIAFGLGAPVVQADTFTVTNNSVGLVAGSLDQAFADAEANAGADTIAFATTIAISSIDVLTSVATVVTAAPHGYTTSDSIVIAGATPDELNGTKTITVVDPTTFTYASTSADGAATGTLTASIPLVPMVATGAVTEDLTIDGSGASYLTIGAYSAINTNGANLTISNLDIDGQTGSRLFYINDGSLTLTDVTIDGNDTDRGGDLYNSNLTVTDSTLSNMRGSSGSAFNAYLDGPAVASSIDISGSDFDSNEATSSGGVIRVLNEDAALDISISDSNFTNNEADAFSGILSVSSEYSYEASAGSGLVSRAETNISISNTSFEDNLAGSGGGVIGLANSGATVSLTIDGGSTFTDNRTTGGNGGVVRVSTDGDTANGENFATTTITINDAEFVSDNQSATGSGGALYIDATNYGSSTLTINNSDFDGFDAQEGRGGTIFQASENTDINLSLSNTTFTNSYADNGGGALYVQTSEGSIDLDIDNVTFDGSESEQAGGAIGINVSGYDESNIEMLNLSISNSTFSNNTSESNAGGAIRVSGSDADMNLDITGSVFYGNDSSQRGGALIITQSDGRMLDLMVSDTTFASNSSNNGSGGAIYLWNNYGDTTVDITGSTFYANDADSAGALVLVSNNDGQTQYGQASHNVSISDTDFVGNYADEGNIGALRIGAHSADVSVSITDSQFAYNESDESIGALYIYQTLGHSDVTISNATFYANKADSIGALRLATFDQYNFDVPDLQATLSANISSSSFTDNEAIYNNVGAISINGNDDYGSLDVAISDSNIDNNSAGGRAGAISMSLSEDASYGSLSIAYSALTNNYSEEGVAGLYVDADGGSLAVNISNSTIAGNFSGSTNERPFALYGESGSGNLDVTIAHTTIADNAGGFGTTELTNSEDFDFRFINATTAFGGFTTLVDNVDNTGGSSFHAVRDGGLVVGDDWGFAVNLGDSHLIRTVRLDGRDDCCNNRIVNGLVRLYSKGQLVHSSDPFTTSSTGNNDIEIPDIEADQIRFVVPDGGNVGDGSGTMNFAELDIFVRDASSLRGAAVTFKGSEDSSGSVSISNSVIADSHGYSVDGQNTADTYDIDIDSGWGSMLTISNSLIGKPATANQKLNFALLAAGADNIIGEDPMLADLANNGGAGLSMMPMSGSPLIDAGNLVDTSVVSDQAGADRVQGGGLDIGAIESAETAASAEETETSSSSSSKTESKSSNSGPFGGLGFAYLSGIAALFGLRRKLKVKKN